MVIIEPISHSCARIKKDPSNTETSVWEWLCQVPMNVELEKRSIETLAGKENFRKRIWSTCSVFLKLGNGDPRRCRPLSKFHGSLLTYYGRTASGSQVFWCLVQSSFCSTILLNSCPKCQWTELLTLFPTTMSFLFPERCTVGPYPMEALQTAAVRQQFIVLVVGSQ